MDVVRRKIHFYELELFNDRVPLTSRERIVELGSFGIRLFAEKSPQRFCYNSSAGILSVIEMVFDGENHRIKGKLLKTRKDIFPDLHNLDDDSLRDIEAEDNEGVAETTHFVIDYTSSVILALEYNHHGAKIRDLAIFLEHLGHVKGDHFRCKHIPIVRDTMYGFMDRVGRFSWLEMRVSKDNIRRLEEIDEGLWSAFNSAQNYGRSEHVRIRYKYEYEKVPDTNFVKRIVLNLVNKIRTDGNRKTIFDVLTVGAEDNDLNNKLQAFDLLSDKIIDEVEVQKHPGKRSIVSVHMFEHLERAVIRHI